MTKPLQFITLRDNTGRNSSLSIHGNRTKGGLTVVGVLPHCTEFLPATKNDRDRMVKFLNELTY